MSEDPGKKDDRWIVSSKGERLPVMAPDGKDGVRAARFINKTAGYLYRTGLIILAVSAVFILLSFISPPKDDPVRRDAVMLMNASVLPYAVAVYCNTEVAADRALLEAVEQWNQRNSVHFERVVEAVKATGDMRTSQKDDMKRNAWKRAKRMVEPKKDKVAYCADYARAVRDGAFDIDKNPETMDAMQRLVAVDLTRRRTRDASGQWKYVE